MKQNSKAVDIGLVVLRFALAGILTFHGLRNVGLIGGSFDQVREAFASLGIAPPLMYGMIATQLGGGLMLVLGFLGRLASLASAVVMGVILFKATGSSGVTIGVTGFELPLALCGMSIGLMLTGMGSLSLDSKLASKMDKVIGKNAT